MPHGRITTLVRFFSRVQITALRIAQYATKNREDALDIVQEAMTSFVRCYSHCDEQEWDPIFHRLLQNQIRDWLRREKVRTRVWVSYDPIEMNVETVDKFDDIINELPIDPHDRIVYDEMIEILRNAVLGLSMQQQKVFYLRVGEGLDINETAQQLGISKSSVKTHYTRAIQTIKKFLQLEETLN